MNALYTAATWYGFVAAFAATVFGIRFALMWTFEADDDEPRPSPWLLLGLCLILGALWPIGIYVIARKK